MVDGNVDAELYEVLDGGFGGGGDGACAKRAAVVGNRCQTQKP